MNVIRLYPPPGEKEKHTGQTQAQSLKAHKGVYHDKKPKTKPIQNQIQNIKTIARLLRKLRHNCVLYDNKT